MKKLLSVSVILLVAGLLGVACTQTKEREIAQSQTKPKISDSDLENRIKAKLNANPQLAAAKLDVDADVDRGEVTLSGTVGSQVLRAEAVDAAKSTYPGLIVNDKIDVKPAELARAEYTEQLAVEERAKAKESGESIGKTLDDAWVHMKIVSKLIGNASTPERKINVDVVNGVVTLRGVVDTADQRIEAERVAKETEGVKSVQNRLKLAAPRAQN
jgi:hyperosmotically inducible periplasmic protein